MKRISFRFPPVEDAVHRFLEFCCIKQCLMKLYCLSILVALCHIQLRGNAGLDLEQSKLIFRMVFIRIAVEHRRLTYSDVKQNEQLKISIMIG